MKGFKRIASLMLCLIALLLCVSSCGGCKKPIYIGVQVGTTGQYFVDGDKEWGFTGIEGYKAMYYESAVLAILDMKSGAVQYVIVDRAPAIQLEKAIRGIKVIDIGLTDEKYAFGVDKEQNALREQINAVLDEKKDEIKAIVDKYAKGTDIVGIESAKKDLDRADKQLVVATSASFNPFEYKLGSKYAGIDIEIMKMVADELNMELVIEDMEFESVITAVGTHGIDVAAAALTVTDVRKNSVNFTNSYYDAAQVLVTISNDKDFDNCVTAEDVLRVLNSKV